MAQYETDKAGKLAPKQIKALLTDFSDSKEITDGEVRSVMEEAEGIEKQTGDNRVALIGAISVLYGNVKDHQLKNSHRKSWPPKKNFKRSCLM